MNSQEVNQIHDYHYYSLIELKCNTICTTAFCPYEGVEADINEMNRNAFQ